MFFLVFFDIYFDICHVGSHKLIRHSFKCHLLHLVVEFGNFSKSHRDLTDCLTPVRRYKSSPPPFRFHSFAVKGASDVCQQNCTAENHSNMPHSFKCFLRTCKTVMHGYWVLTERRTLIVSLAFMTHKENGKKFHPNFFFYIHLKISQL